MSGSTRGEIFMKRWIYAISLLITLFSLEAFAKDGYARRYRTTYSSFDTGFNRQYHYREMDQRCRYRTCLESNFQNRDYVYVEETVIYDSVYGEQRMVRVYDTDRYDSYLVTYYVVNDNRNSYVRARRYNEHCEYYHQYYYYYTPYIMPGLALSLEMMDSFDRQSQALLVAGGIVFDLGLNIATSCRTRECMDVSGDLLLLGIASSVSASISNAINEANRKTELEKQIRNIESDESDNVR